MNATVSFMMLADMDESIIGIAYHRRNEAATVRLLEEGEVISRQNEVHRA